MCHASERTVAHLTQDDADLFFILREADELDADAYAPLNGWCGISDLPFEPKIDRTADRGSIDGNAPTYKLPRLRMVERDA